MKFNNNLSILHWVFTTFLLLISGCSYSVPNLSTNTIMGHLQKIGHKPSRDIILVDTKKQTLSLLKDGTLHKTYTIATGKKGLGQRINTFQTPRGLHRVNEKIGDGVPKYGIFHKRNFTGLVWKKAPGTPHLKDYISTRILRLEGLQPGFNKGRDLLGRVVDTEARAVYIHGTTMENRLGFPSTKGCIHMTADDVVSLFNEMEVGSLVWIN